MSSKFISRGADKYDSFMGRWSRRLAPLFIDFAGLAAGDRVLEVGCGTGSLTFALVKHANVTSVEAIDYEQQFIDAARERNTDPRINIQRGDACQLEFSDGQFDRALSMLVLQFVTDPERAVFETLLIGVTPVLCGRRHDLANSLASLRRPASSTSWKRCSVSKWVLQTSMIIGFRQQARAHMPDIWKVYLTLHGNE